VGTEGSTRRVAKKEKKMKKFQKLANDVRIKQNLRGQNNTTTKIHKLYTEDIQQCDTKGGTLSVEKGGDVAQQMEHTP
jgi:hypothetical protein